MKPRRHRGTRADRSGVALLLALLLLFVLIAVGYSISITTRTDAEIARNDFVLTSMDLALESALLQVHETLKTDADAGGGASAGAPAGASPAGGNQAAGDPSAAGAAGAAGGAAEPTDSRRDEWASPQRTEINEMKLRIWCVDEDSKYNVLNMLNADEKEAEAAFERVARILDLCREGTRVDIDTRMAEDMAKAMREHLTKRRDSKLPRPTLLTDLEQNEDLGMPLSLREFAVLEPFEASHFQDFRDSDGTVVHSIDSFLTVWTSLATASSLPAGAAGAAGASGTAGSTPAGGSSSNSSRPSTGSKSKSGSSSSAQGGGSGGSGGGTTAQGGSGGTGAASGGAAAGAAGSTGGSSGGFGVNVNTAPNAVLHGLFEGRDVDPRLWDEIVEYRNLEEEEEEDKDSGSDDSGAKEEEPALDEYGREIVKRQIFESLAELADVEGFSDLPSEMQQKVNQLLTTKSNVFSIYVVARKITSLEGDATGLLDPVEQRKREETAGDSLVRVVRSVVWRRKVGEEQVITPIVRWEILDYVPYEILDYPDEER